LSSSVHITFTYMRSSMDERCFDSLFNLSWKLIEHQIVCSFVGERG